MRTLTFGDRTISYDAGLDSISPVRSSGENLGNDIYYRQYNFDLLHYHKFDQD